MIDDDWEISAADVSEVEAKVVIRFRPGSDESIELHGLLRGPYCERAHTLPADFPFRQFGAAGAAAVAVVTDPCLWSDELPHLYRAEMAAMRGDVVLAEYHGEIGLRRTSPAKNWDHIK